MWKQEIKIATLWLMGIVLMMQIDVMGTNVKSMLMIYESRARGDHWAKIVEQRAIKNRVQYIHCR
jgi:hypothetical protein